jgi:NhaP-type Na+/H+ or K+/H+ antiporter
VFLAYLGAVAIQGNGFVAAFVGGLAFGASRNRFAKGLEFTDTFGTFLTVLVWTIFGLTLVTALVKSPHGWLPLAYAVLSLTVVRMVPVAIAMIGTHFRAPTVLVMGWFGPRGLASVVFTLLALTEFKAGGRPYDTPVAAATCTILLSVVAHGLSAEPLSEWYAGHLKRAPGLDEERVDVPAPPTRSRSRFRDPVRDATGSLAVDSASPEDGRPGDG